MQENALLDPNFLIEVDCNSHEAKCFITLFGVQRLYILITRHV